MKRPLTIMKYEIRNPPFLQKSGTNECINCIGFIDKITLYQTKACNNNSTYSSAEKLKIQMVETAASPRKFIELKIGTVDIKNKKTDNDEAYSLKVDHQKEVIKIVGTTPRGVFWGVQSLLSIVNDGKVPWVTVEDVPRYEYRGLSIDVARNFLPYKEVMRILDGMAMFKMNKLHLHLTDDEGWRLEIPGLPELTEVGLQVEGDVNR